MATRLSRIFATLILASAAAAGCAIFSHRVAGCVPPSDESLLLDEFAKEPVLAVSPAGSSRREEPQRTVACRRVGAEVSVTAVHVQYDLSGDLGQDEARTLYDPVAAQAGWTPLPSRADERALRYCRTVLGQPGILEVHWEDAKTLDSVGKLPGTVSVVVRHALAELAEVDADRRAAGCWARAFRIDARPCT